MDNKDNLWLFISIICKHNKKVPKTYELLKCDIITNIFEIMSILFFYLAALSTFFIILFPVGGDSQSENDCYYGNLKVKNWRQFAKLPIRLSHPTTFVTTTFGQSIENKREVIFVVGKSKAFKVENN